MASSSSSSSSNKYDVFLSFRGEDTRQYFISHLHDALCKNQIKTFIDNQLIRGDEISPSLLNAIKQSKIAVVILSESYASSRWCLEELVKILQCKNKYEQIVIPVFYDVDPSDVRHQTGNFGDGFSELKRRFMKRVKKLEKWKKALREVADLSGFDSRAIRPESVLVQQIVDDILKRLNDMFPTELDKDLVGIESRIKEIRSLGSDNFMDVVNTLGIWGIGGVGKTTIARAIFNRFSHYFDGSCFLQNIREESERNGGLAQLQREFLSTLLGDRNLNNCFSSFNYARKMIGRKKVLIVFDDVTSFQQIKSLIGNFDWLENGSVVIITTRDKQILRNCGVKIEYEMKELEDDDALKLFSRYAFKGDQPNIGYEELSSTVIKYCHGIPLALEVLGCFLSGKSKKEWKSSIKKLERIPKSEIQNVLKISYDGLDEEEQNIFLDIACFLKGEGKDFAIQFLDACGYNVEIGLRSLEDKCLIKLSEANKIIMHDLLQQMGWEIVRQESVKDPGKRSRLWHPEEIYEVLEDNTGTEAIQAISLDVSEIKVDEINLNLYIFQKMLNLRFLKIRGDNKFKIRDFEGSGYVFRKLRYLDWEGYPLKSLPQSIRTENLVFLRLIHSKVEELWNGVQDLRNLKEIDLGWSEHLTTLPDLSKAQNLETLDLWGCSNLKRLPNSLRKLESLEVLDLSHCSNLRRLPNSLCKLESLKYLNLSFCSNLRRLPNSLCKLESLEFLNLTRCSNLRRLPDKLGNLEASVDLSIEGTLIREIPSSILCLNNLRDLYISGLRGHRQNSVISFISYLVGLQILELVDCGITELSESLGQLFSLRILNLDENNFERIPKSIRNLSSLEDLSLRYCQSLQSLPKLPPNLADITARNCTSLESLSTIPIGGYAFGRGYDFRNCYKLGGDEVGRIFEVSLQKIQLMENWNNGVPRSIIFPGSEIPEWFENQSTESSITVEIPPTDHQKLIGFAFCFIVAFEEYKHSEREFFLSADLKFRTVDGNWHLCCSRFIVLPYTDSDHVILGYEVCEDMLKFSDINKVFIQFSIKENPFRDESLNCCKWLKKCGIHLLFNQDYGESMTDCSSTMRKKKRMRKKGEHEMRKKKRMRNTQ